MVNLPQLTKNILLINFFVWLLDTFLRQQGVDVIGIFGLHYFSSSSFHIWQPFTYMFLHANFSHLFCNMFAVLMFGSIIERNWGYRRLLIYYLICGLGAALVQEIVWAVKIHLFLSTDGSLSLYALSYINQVVTIGASGAVFGIMFAFGWLFPNVPMFIIFLPIPIAARKFVFIYAAIELFAGLAPIHGDNIAHFAHLGGMLFGWLLLLWWRNGFRWKNQINRTFFKQQESNNSYSGYHYKKNIEQ